MDRQSGVRRGQCLMRLSEKFAFDVEQRDAPAFGQETLGRREADTPRRAGNNCDLVLFRGHLVFRSLIEAGCAGYGIDHFSRATTTLSPGCFAN